MNTFFETFWGLFILEMGAAIVIFIIGYLFFIKERKTIHEELKKDEFLRFAQTLERKMKAKGYPCHITIKEKIIRITEGNDKEISEATYDEITSWECEKVKIDYEKPRISNKFNNTGWESMCESLAEIKANRKEEKTIIIDSKPRKCSCCGAPLPSDKNECAYCNTTYE